MFDPQQFRVDIIRNTLQPINLWSAKVEELLMITCSQESLGGTYLKQVNGPALGVYQMEPATLDDIWTNYLVYNHDLEYKILRALSLQQKPADDTLIYNLMYATIMCRVHYLRVKEEIPLAGDIVALATYYKKYYNTGNGAATVEQVINNYHRFIGLSK